MLCGQTGHYHWTYSAQSAAEWRYSLQLITPPTAGVEPLKLPEVKKERRVDADDNSQDSRLQDHISTAREFCETYLDRQLITAIWQLTAANFPLSTRDNPTRSIYLPKPPLQSVGFVKYVDTSGTLTTFASSNYSLETPTKQQGRIHLNYGVPWPFPQSHPTAVQIQFVCGYGTAPTDVPHQVRQAMHLLIGEYYEDREPGPEVLDRVYTLLSGASWGALL